MDISDFIGAAKTFHVLGIKVTKDGDLINEWYSEPECRRNIYLQRRASHPVQLVLLSRKDYCL
ncbi:hypothetical protein [Blautia sp. OF09-25XD]|uniref:hypothetical protein n=1 Tax=Blautia sp. OF09-25XD TaxID=2292981 RepID=UPI001FAA37AD|nr:hypothetical protein [Blautia sp. OF09-25XD]